MTAILYPVAETAEAALHAPLGYATRAAEAEQLAAGSVMFDTQMVGPAFADRDAAMAAYAGAQGARSASSTGRIEAQIDEAHGVRLVPVEPGGAGRAQGPVQPSYMGGRRWPSPPSPGPSLAWRLSISFWRVGGERSAPPPVDEARRVRRDEAARALTSPALAALTRQPMRALRPQQPLDIGLFEMRPPEAPDNLIPDE